METNTNTLSGLDSAQQQLILEHLAFITKENEKTNLTRISDYDEALLLHVEDSLIVLDEIKSSIPGEYVDLGSGAGYPGIPISVTTGRKTTLVESSSKKASVLESFVAAAELSELITVYSGRAEELACARPNEFSVATARALAPISSLLELSSPLLKSGGRLICLKAIGCDEEIEKASKIEEKLGLALFSDREVLLSDEKTPRRVVSYEKVASPKVKLPRRPGMAQKRPYIK